MLHYPNFAQASALSASQALRTHEGKRRLEPAANKNASRDLDRKFRKLGYSLPVEIHHMKHETTNQGCVDNVETYHVKPSSWVKYWMNECPQILGGWSGSAKTNFRAFWEAYRTQHPNHKIFTTHSTCLQNVVPILLHGDEGRALKRTNYLVFAMESPFGSLNDPSVQHGCTCSADLETVRNLPSYGSERPTLSPEDIEILKKQVTNYTGHSYLSHWLLFGVAGWLYKKEPHIVDELFAVLTNDLKELFFNGVQVSNSETLYGAVINIKGDMAFHKTTMSLTRSYSNLSTVADVPICHSCAAGSPGIAFEDVTEDPCWVPTMFFERPWPLDNPPILSRIPYDDTCPEQILCGDIFHVHKLGLMRDTVGSVVIILVRLGFTDYPGSTTNIVDRLARAHTYFSMWCRETGHAPGLRSFTKAFFNLKTLISSPWVNSKGSDSVMLVKWLVFQLKIYLNTPTVNGYNDVLQRMLQLCEACLELRMVHSHSLWLSRPCARKLYYKIMSALRGYSLMGRISIRLKIRAFAQKPKMHALHHLAWHLKVQLQKGAALIWNPQGWGCEMNEDFVGRISRLSRRVSVRTCDKQVFERYFLKVNALLRRRKDHKFQPLNFQSTRRKRKFGR